MLEYTRIGDGARLTMLVLHDDAQREYAYGPARGLPDTKAGTFTQELYDEAMKGRLDCDQHEKTIGSASLRSSSDQLSFSGNADTPPEAVT